MKKLIRVPATTANLGPGFDVLGMALSIWNEAEVTAAGEDVTIAIEGFGAGEFPADARNLVVRSANFLHLHLGVTMGLHFNCHNRFPGNSGLGSSSSAILLGLVGANALLETPLGNDDLLVLANELEGHPDNVTPALLGGLTMSVTEGRNVVARKVLPAAGWQVGVIVPELAISTKMMRAALNPQVPMADAVFNISRSVMVVKAFEMGDLELLRVVMADRIHQPLRLPLIRGAADAIRAAQESGLPAALSGAGPGVIVFGLVERRVQEAVESMKRVFMGEGLTTWEWVGKPDLEGTQIL